MSVVGDTSGTADVACSSSLEYPHYGYEAGFVAPIQGPIGNGDTPLVPVTTP